MKIKQSTDATFDKSGLEDLLLQSQSGLVMLREMKSKRERKWQEISERYGYATSLDTTIPSSDTAPTAQQRLDSGSHPPITIRLVEYNRQKARVCRLFLSRTRLLLDGGQQQQRGRQSREQSVKRHHAAVKTLAEATHNQHRLMHHSAGIAVNPRKDAGSDPSHTSGTDAHSLQIVQLQDMEMYIRYTHEKLRVSLPLERLFIRMRWLCTSHRYHLRQRMLALHHRQKANNSPISPPTIAEKIKNRDSVAAASSSHALVHCPLFALSPIQLDAELKKRMQRHLVPSSPSFSSMDASVDVVALKAQVNQLLARSIKVDAIDSSTVESEDTAEDQHGSDEKSETPSEEQQMAPFYSRARVRSHWEILQLDILECSDQNADPGGEVIGTTHVQRTDAPSSRKHDDDPLLRNEWDLLRLSDMEYVRIRIEALASTHFDRATVDLRTKGAAVRPSSSSKSDKPQHSSDGRIDLEGGRQPPLFGDPTTSTGESISPDAVYALYVLRVVSCRAKRHRLLRLLNYFHYIALARRGSGEASPTPSENVSNGTGTAAKTKANSTFGSHPASRWQVEKRQNEFVVMENRERRGPGSGSELDEDGDREVFFPAAKRDLEIMERHMLRIASVFVQKQERDSLPTPQAANGSRVRRGDGVADDPGTDSVVMAIDRMEVICDIYDCELSLLQAKLELVHLLVRNGCEFLEDAESHETGSQDLPLHSAVLLSIFQHRPLIDFSHAYFYESYAAEILHLELQASLQQQIRDHFIECQGDLSTTNSKNKNSDDKSADGEEESQWFVRKLIHADLISRLSRHQDELIQEAEQKWFCIASVGELHVLHQAIYEKVLVDWKLIVSVELSTIPAQCLERSSDDLLKGNGWQLVFPPNLIMDCCRNLQLNRPAGANPTHVSDLVRSMIHALALMEWHQELGRKVYEAKVLERIHRFQYDFVNRMDSSDQLHHFFFDGTPGETEADGLVPIASDLLGEREFVRVAAENAAITGSKTVPEWLEIQLLVAERRSIDGGDGRKSWHFVFSDFQTRWTRFLADVVRYQDLIGAEVFDFASCSPFLFLASSSERDSTVKSAKAVQSKYAEELAEKMQDEMQQNCFPYWISLEQLKDQLKQRFFIAQSAAPSPKAGDSPSRGGDEPQDVDHDSPSYSVETVYILRCEACSQYLQAEAAVPRYLVRVDRCLTRFRNERALMQTLSPPVAAACAFTANRASHQDAGQKTKSLTRWLTSKLDQLRQDTYTKDRPRSDFCAAMDAFDAAQGKSPRHSPSVHAAVEETQLLLAIPSQRYLIDQFAVPLCREQPSAAFSQAFALANEERVETLRTLSSILEHFHSAVDLIRVKSSFHFVVKRYKSAAKASGHHRKRIILERSKATGRMAAHGLLERWQAHFHEEIRGFHDRIVDSLPQSAAFCNIYARTSSDSVKNANQSQSPLLQTISRCTERSNTELATFLRCATSFLFMQTIGNQHFEGDGMVDPACRKGGQRKRLQRCLWDLSDRLKTDQARRCQRSHDDILSRFAPILSSASEMLQLFYKSASTSTLASQSEREVCAFWEELVKTQHDLKFVACLTDWLDLQRVFVWEHIRPSLPAHGFQAECTDDGTSIAVSPPYELEVSAIAALEKVWERYELIVPEHEHSNAEQSTEPGYQQASSEAPGETPLVRLRGNHDDRRARLGQKGYSRGSFAQRSDLMAITSGGVRDAVLLPSQGKLTHQLEFLRLHFELVWLQADIMEMERHYESFLNQRRKYQSVQIATTTSGNTHKHRQQGSCSPSLLSMSKYYRRIEEEGRENPSSVPSNAHGEQQVTRRFSRGELVIPASEMNMFLQDMAAECAQHHSTQTGVYESAIQTLQRQLRSVHRAYDVLQVNTTRGRGEERIKRESYAVDHAYQLHFQMETLKKEMEGMANRMDLERWELQCQLSEEYEKKLAAMHAQLLTKQQQFDEYRVTMQHDLHAQLQGAQTQLVQQLVDHSGSVTVEMKAHFLANLRGQHEHDHVQKENVALKQTLLRLQSLLAMQQQTHDASREREETLQRRHKAADVMLRNEAAQLQQRIKQLEGDMSKLSQEKTVYMLKWNSLQKQSEAAAQKRREAKVRALSVPYHRAVSAAPFPIDIEAQGEVGSVSIAAGMEVNGSSRRPQRRGRLPSVEDEEEAFEQEHEVKIRQKVGHLSGAVEEDGDCASSSSNARSERHFQNSARHFQNEIRRLQQQLAKESKQKATLMDQVTQLRSQNLALSSGDNQHPFHEEDTAEMQPPCVQGEDEFSRIQQVRLQYPQACQGLTLRMSSPSARTPSAGVGRVLTAPSTSPRVRAKSASVCTPTRPAHPAAPTGAAGVAHKRPSSSFSPRSSSLHRTQAATLGIASPRSSGLPPASASSAVVVAPATPTRKFEVQKRTDAKIGGIAGVPNTLSVREPLPYR